jgi:hypothetical protein
MQQDTLVFSSTNLSVLKSSNGSGICLKTVRTVKIISYLRMSDLYSFVKVQYFACDESFFAQNIL